MLVEGTLSYSVCRCTHLTNFAILMQVVPLEVRAGRAPRRSPPSVRLKSGPGRHTLRAAPGAVSLGGRRRPLVKGP